MRENLFTQEIVRQLALAETCHEFLATAVHALEQAHGRGVKAKISRAAGFHSRSYITEVLSGKKGLSRDSAARLRGALKLPSAAGKLFECLANDPKNPKLNNLRLELANYTPKAREVAQSNLREPEVFQVYAALGTETEGASLEEILRRTQLSELAAKSGLSALMASEAAVEKEGRFYALSSKADCLASADDQSVAEMVQKVCAGIQKNRQSIVADSRNLNIYSAFSVRLAKIPELKKSLEKAVMDVLDEYQDDSGDCIEQVFVSLFRQPM